MTRSTGIFLLLLLAAPLAGRGQTYTPPERVYWLSKVWRDVGEHFHDPGRLQRIGWDSLYTAAIPEALAAEGDDDFFRLLKRQLAAVGDGHTEWLDNDRMRDSLRTGVWDSPTVCHVEWIEGRYWITSWVKGCFPGMALPQELLAVDGTQFEEYLEEQIMPYVSGGTPQVKRLYALSRFLDPAAKGTCRRLKLRDAEGKVTERVMEYALSEKAESYADIERLDPVRRGLNVFKETDRYGNPCFRMQFPGFPIHSYSMTPLLHMLRPTVDSCAYIVLDLRRNGGGSEPMADTLLMSLLDTDTLRTFRSVYRVNDGMKAAYGLTFQGKTFREDCREYYEAAALDTLPESVLVKEGLPTFRQPLYVLTGPRTLSAAEDLLLALRLHHPGRAVFFGEPTGGSTGLPLVRILDKEGKLCYRICTRRPIGLEGYAERGILPDVTVEPTLEEYISGHDRIYDIVAEYYKKNDKHESK